jgi:hypothetical protein
MCGTAHSNVSPGHLRITLEDIYLDLGRMKTHTFLQALREALFE